LFSLSSYLWRRGGLWRLEGTFPPFCSERCLRGGWRCHVLWWRGCCHFRTRARGCRTRRRRRRCRSRRWGELRNLLFMREMLGPFVGAHDDHQRLNVSLRFGSSECFPRCHFSERNHWVVLPLLIPTGWWPDSTYRTRPVRQPAIRDIVAAVRFVMKQQPTTNTFRHAPRPSRSPSLSCMYVCTLGK